MKRNDLNLVRIHIMDQIEAKLSNTQSLSDFVEMNYFLALNEIVCELEKEIENLDVSSCQNIKLARQLNSSIVAYNFKILDHIKNSKSLNC